MTCLRTQPNDDRSHRGCAEVDVAALVIPGGDGSELLELDDGPLDGVALLVALGVEGRLAARESDFSGIVCGILRRRR
jgi:hypothetical protein